MNENCPTCGQPWPGRTGRICSVCGVRMGRHDKYRVVGSSLQHRNCHNPTMRPDHPPPMQTAFLAPEEPRMDIVQGPENGESSQKRPATEV